MNLRARAGIARIVAIVFVLLLALPDVAAAAAPTWSNPIANGAVGSPPGRYLHTAVYDAAGNNLIVFGGCGTGTCPSNDVWVLSHANGSGGTPTWSNTVLNGAAGSPAARYEHTAVYDAAGNNLIVFGGNASGFGPVNDVWVLSHANGSGGTPTWSLTSLNGAPGSPAPRENHTAVYDAAGNNLIVFGGYASCCGFTNDVWVLSHANGSGGTPTWTNLIANGAVGSPPARDELTAVYDAAGNNMIVFGGCVNGACPSNDVWVLSHANGSGGTPTWSNLIVNGAVGSPPAHNSHTAVYDAAGNNMIVFGGYEAGIGEANDVWVLSHANGSGGTPIWTNPVLNGAAGSPAARYGHTAVYDAAGNNMIVFGGVTCPSSCVYLNDVWVLANASPYTPPTNVAVNIDIRPNTAINTISLTQGTEVPVAILSSATFDATTQVDRTSLTFGHAGTEASFKSCNVRATDVNADGYKDLVCHFNGTLGGFVLGDTVGKLQGKTTLGGTIIGSDSVLITK